MVAGLVFSDLFGEGIVDLRESFYAHHVWFFALGFFVILVSIGKSIVLYGELLHSTDLAFHAFFGTIFLIGALTRRESCSQGSGRARNGRFHSLYRYCLCATSLVHAKEERIIAPSFDVLVWTLVDAAARIHVQGSSMTSWPDHSDSALLLRRAPTLSVLKIRD